MATTQQYQLGDLEPPTIQAYTDTTADYLWFCVQIQAAGDPPGCPPTYRTVAVYLVWFTVTRASAASLGKKLSALKKVLTFPPYNADWFTEKERVHMAALRKQGSGEEFRRTRL